MGLILIFLRRMAVGMEYDCGPSLGDSRLERFAQKIALDEDNAQLKHHEAFS
jgi:hypothetical protein